MPRPRQRLLFYAHDNRGLGHLMRSSRVAAVLQDEFSCLFITGSREAAWIVPAGCPYVYIPSLDKKFRDDLASPAVIDREVAIRIRSRLIAAVVRDFAPHAFIIDHLAAGRRGELMEALAISRARKYLVLRGVIDDSVKANAEVFPPTAMQLLENAFSRVLIACDRNISCVEDEYLAGEAPRIRSMLRYVGYVSPKYTVRERQSIRARFGISRAQPWVVCSAGGGRESADFVNECIALAGSFPNAAFDVVRGPRATPHHSDTVQASANLRVWSTSLRLPLLHAAADAVICRGGYNTLMEVAAGGARAICVPLDAEEDREQSIHAARLASHIPIDISSARRNDLAVRLRSLLAARKPSMHSWREHSRLQFNGLEEIRRIVTQDLTA